jgi:hypothetical protein
LIFIEKVKKGHKFQWRSNDVTIIRVSVQLTRRNYETL